MGRTRPLTEKEKKMIKNIYGPNAFTENELSSIGISESGILTVASLFTSPPAVTPFSIVHFSTLDFHEDFSASSVSTTNKEWFIHEIFHTLQYFRGRNVFNDGLDLHNKNNGATHNFNKYKDGDGNFIPQEATYYHWATETNSNGTLLIRRFCEYGLEEQATIIDEFFAAREKQRTNQALEQVETNALAILNNSINANWLNQLDDLSEIGYSQRRDQSFYKEGAIETIAGDIDQGRLLMPSEVEFLKGIYGDNIEWHKVRIRLGFNIRTQTFGETTIYDYDTYPNQGINLGVETRENTIYFEPNKYSNDLTRTDEGKATLAREMLFVLSHQKGRTNLPEDRKLLRMNTKKDLIYYKWLNESPFKNLGEYGIEEQAKIMEHYTLYKLGYIEDDKNITANMIMAKNKNFVQQFNSQYLNKSKVREKNLIKLGYNFDLTSDIQMVQASTGFSQAGHIDPSAMDGSLFRNASGLGDAPAIVGGLVLEQGNVAATGALRDVPVGGLEWAA